jgi:hypothetical protein
LDSLIPFRKAGVNYVFWKYWITPGVEEYSVTPIYDPRTYAA